jgi:hypothetical protein
MPGDLSFTRLAPDLLDKIAQLRHARGANGMSFRFETSARVDGA